MGVTNIPFVSFIIVGTGEFARRHSGKSLFDVLNLGFKFFLFLNKIRKNNYDLLLIERNL